MTSARRWLREVLTALRFGIVGIAATLTHFTVLAGLLHFDVLGPVLANGCAYAVAVAASFLGHHFWTYRAGGSLVTSFMRYVAASGSAFLVSTLLLLVLIRFAHVPDAVAAFLAAAAVPVFSFVVYRLWVFRPRG